MVLRKNLERDGLSGLDFISSLATVEEVRKIITSYVIEKHAIIFKIAVCLNFFKTDVNGDVTKVTPVFTSNNVYLNTVSSYNTEQILNTFLFNIKQRFDDFISRGSGEYCYGDYTFQY